MPDYVLDPIDQQRRLAWFRAARFGMFIHWGLYSQLGRHEWVMQREQIPIPEYEKLAATWHPRLGMARDWARLAKRAGMRYMVLTSKHCEGYSLWDSAVNPYNALRSGPGRDLIAEYVEAVRSEGLKVGLYYSLMDWHHPDAAVCYHDPAARRRFVDYTHGLVHELCSNYGKIDILWYDAVWPFMNAEGWESAKLNAMVRQLQPDILLNNRAGLPEDFGTPEQYIAPEKDGRAWESCMTFNGAWGYFPADTHYKDAWTVLGMLRQVAAGGGNLLLNVGPAPDGSIPQPCQKALLEVGDWLGKYGASIYDATDHMRQEWQVTGAFTVKGNTAYYHCKYWPGTELSIGGIQTKLVAARLMHGPAIRFSQVDRRIVLHDLPPQMPEPLATVIELEFAAKPYMILGSGYELIADDPYPAKVQSTMPMTGRERLLAAIRHEEPDRVPIAPRIWAFLMARSGSYDISCELRAAEEFGYDLYLPSAMPQPALSSPALTYRWLRPDVKVTQTVEEEDGYATVRRRFDTPTGPLSDVISLPPPGREYGISANPLRHEYMIREASDLDRLAYILPDPTRPDVARYRELSGTVGERGMVEMTINPPLDYTLGDLRGLTQLMIDYYEDRPFFDRMFAFFQDYALRLLKAVLEGGVPYIFGTWFYGSVSAGWGPRIFHEVFAPLIKQHADLVHHYGGLYHIYDDGKMMQTLADYVAAGADVVETLTPPPVGDVDLAQAKRLYGEKTCLKGYIDLLYVIKEGRPALIDDAVRQAIEVAAPGGGFILGTSDSIRDGTPLENVQAYFAAAHQYGAYSKR